MAILFLGLVVLAIILGVPGVILLVLLLACMKLRRFWWIFVIIALVCIIAVQGGSI